LLIDEGYAVAVNEAPKKKKPINPEEGD
jgi:hypothetical protein